MRARLNAATILVSLRYSSGDAADDEIYDRRAYIYRKAVGTLLHLANTTRIYIGIRFRNKSTRRIEGRKALYRHPGSDYLEQE